MSTPTLLVLAAGMGSRYGGLKQIDPIGPAGETIIDYSVYDALRAGFGKVVFVIRREIEPVFREVIGGRFEGRMAVEYAHQELDTLTEGFPVPAGRSKPWGTTHAILMAADVIREPFAVINADDFYGAQSFRLLAQHLQAGGADYAMVGFVLRKTLSEFGGVARGVCRVGDTGHLASVVELTEIARQGSGDLAGRDAGQRVPLTGEEVVSMNMWAFTPGVFEPLRQYFREFLMLNGQDVKSECYIPSAVNDLIRSNRARVNVLRTDEAWFGVTYPEDRSRVVDSIRQLTARGLYPERLWS